MLTPDRRALFRAAYSALLLRVAPDETNQPPAPPSADEQPDPKNDTSSPAPDNAEGKP